MSTLQEGRYFPVACAVLQRVRSETPDRWVEDRLGTCAVEYARQIEREDCDPPTFAQVKNIVIKELKGVLAFRAAWRTLTVLAKSKSWPPKEKVWIIQQLALCTYKDEELQPGRRFDKALDLLKSIGLCDPDGVNPAEIPPSTLPETLALGGAVYKRKWENDGQIEHLYQALIFYRGAWRFNASEDMGYGGVNAAYILDVLAARAKIIALRSGLQAAGLSSWREDAEALRWEMKEKLPEIAAQKKATGEYPGITNEYWYQVTMAEIHFGLQEYEEAGTWLRQASNRDVLGNELASDWELQTTFRQLVTLARFQDVDLLDTTPINTLGQRARAALYELLGEDTERALSCYRGRVGLALSGGGFRASLFHLGVLARLAETNVLPSVEVLSTVSGGSIVGAYYYLEVRELLRKKADRDIERADYIEIVQRIIENFLAGVKLNLRTRVVSNLLINLKMILGSYSRSHRIGELYEKHLYSGIRNSPADGKYLMRDLLIAPEGKEFNPKFSNWRRRAKVPVILLNSTSLNSGHSWQFTARWMGEAPGLVGQEVDVNERYRRLYYEQAPRAEFEEYRLGYAVAASACVPGLFDPLVLTDLYPGRAVRLVDGGVHDNQGAGTLLDEGCTLLFCSDASGQMADVAKPADASLGVALRSNSILQSCVREARYQDLKGRVDSRAIQGLFFIHLKRGLESAPLDWIDCQDPTVPPQITAATTDYGVDKDLQRSLSAVRTDLDSFTEVEAYTLMLSGYLMTARQLEELQKQHRANGEPGSWGGFDIHARRGEWVFRGKGGALESLVRLPSDSSDLRRKDLGEQIRVSSSGAFKIWRLSPVLRATAAILGAAALAGIGWVLREYWNSSLQVGPFSMSVRGLAIAVVLAVAGIFVPLLKWLRPREAMQSIIAKTALAFAGFVFSNLHLWTFDKLFLRRGRLERLMRLQ
ncbi:MAG: patatin-like phospholipase family protein [Silvibacterium sp.]|nr:patatin-like phospholipase family protein [Silvibacterium sp.]